MHEPAWRRLRAVTFGLLVLASASLGLEVRGRPGFPVDRAILHAVQATHGIEAPLGVLSAIGFAPLVDVVDGLVILVLFGLRRRWEALATTLAGGGGALLNFVAKALFERPRPPAGSFRVDHAIPNSSFPAGHVLNFTVFGGFLGYLAWTRLPPSWPRSAFFALLIVLELAMGIARIDSGEHWPSDVLGGYLIGGAWLIAMIEIDRRGRARFGRTP